MGPLSRHILALAFLCFFTGCDRTESPSTDAAEPITIVYWTTSWWGDPSQFQGGDPVSAAQWQRDRIREFERDHPGVKVDLQVDPGGLGDKLRIAFAGRVPPDVFHGNPGQEFLTWASLGFLEPIDPFLTVEDRSDIRPAALAAGAYQDQHFAWPFYNHALCVAINRDLFKERGLHDRIPGPQADWTFEEYSDLARQLTFDRNNDGRTDVYGVGMHTLDANHEFLTTYLINAGAGIFDQQTGRFILDSDAGLKGMRFIRALYDAGYVTPGVSSYKQDDIRSLFFNQQVAMYLTNAGIFDWAEDQVRKQTLKRFDWALVPVPHEPGIDQKSYLAVGAVYVARQEDARKRDACMALARYITGPEINQWFWNRASPRRSSPRPADPNMAVMMEQVDRAENFMMSPRRLPDRFDLTNEMVLMFQRVFARPAKGEAGEILKQTAAGINARLTAAKEED